MKDDVLEVDENPFAVSLTLFAEGAETGLFGFFNDSVGDGFDVSVGVTRRNDHGVGYIR
jgi:hypothetical protein